MALVQLWVQASVGVVEQTDGSNFAGRMIVQVLCLLGLDCEDLWAAVGLGFAGIAAAVAGSLGLTAALRGRCLLAVAVERRMADLVDVHSVLPVSLVVDIAEAGQTFVADRTSTACLVRRLSG